MSSSSSRFHAACSAFLAASILLTAAPPIARAEPTPQDKTTARDAVLAGRDLRAKKDFKGALEKFRVAYALVPSPITAYEVGRAYVDAGLLVEGYEKLVEASTLPVKASESAEAKKARADAKQLADDTASRIPSITIKLANVPTNGATVSVTIDGRAVPTDALTAPLKVNPGDHEIIATIEGTAPKKRSVTVVESEAKDVSIRLPDAPAAPAAKTTDGGTKRGRSSEPPRVDAGGGTSTWTYVGFTIAGVGLVVGGVTGAVASSKGSTLSDECRSDHHCPTSESGQIGSYNAFRYGSFASIAVAVVGVGIGIGGLVVGGSKERPAAGVTVTPWIGIGSVGLQGAF